MTIDGARKVAAQLWCNGPRSMCRPAVWRAPFSKLCCMGYLGMDNHRYMMARGETWEEAVGNAYRQAEISKGGKS